MSQIFSDPPFRRGTTLCAGDLTGTGTGNDLPGAEIVGQVKVFQDVNPSSGVRNSNRLVYCVACRYKGTTVSDGSTVAGLAYTIDLAFENGKPFATFTTAATNTDAGNLRHIGVLDEYLTGSLTQNDVAWLVIKGPTSFRQSASTSLASGAKVELTGSAGKMQAVNTGTPLGIQIAGAATTTADANVRVNLVCDWA